MRVRFLRKVTAGYRARSGGSLHDDERTAAMVGEAPERLVVVVTTGIEEYQSRILTGIHRVLAPHGFWQVSISSVACARSPDSDRLPESLVRLIRRAAPCGVIATTAVAEGEEQALIELLRAEGIPVVLIGTTHPGVSAVRVDNAVGMRALMGHLLDECRIARPALVRGLAHHPDSLEREAVFRDELARRGLVLPEDHVVDGDFWHDRSRQVVRGLFDSDPSVDAVVAANDLSAIGALRAVGDVGRVVPDDVLVTGFDNDRRGALTWPGLTTVDQDLEGQGAAAASLLVEQLDGAPPGRVVMVPSRLVVRGSTCGHRDLLHARDAAVTMSLAAQDRLAARDAILGLNRALLRCGTVDQVIEALAARLDRLGLIRFFLAIDEALVHGRLDRMRPDRVRLLLAYRDGEVLASRGHEVFGVHRLLPEEFRAELSRGLLTMQALTAGEREFGYVLFDQHAPSARVSEMLHVDLSRTLEAVFGTQQLRSRAADLQRIVTQQTRELEAEVETRRRAEQELQQANRELQVANEELRRSVMVDGLTRIANRTAFEQHLERHWRARAAGGGELALLMIDVDLFKAYNDRYGHVRGDETLRHLASLLRRSVRYPADLACRYGGEEFALVLPDSGAEAAMTVANRFRRLLAEAAIEHLGSSVANVVTASVGVAVSSASCGTPPEIVLEAADQALYRAKALGRNQVAIAGPIVLSGRDGLRAGEITR